MTVLAELKSVQMRYGVSRKHNAGRATPCELYKSNKGHSGHQERGSWRQ
jgi:hypothetical protein